MTQRQAAPQGSAPVLKVTDWSQEGILLMVSKRKGWEFGEWLDLTLSNKRIMGRTLAEAVGVHDSAVSRWRAGAGVPSMETLALIAEFLDVDPLRLAVTAGQVPQRVAGVDPLPLPEPTAQRESVKRQIARIKGVTDASRRKLLATYEEIMTEEAQGEEG